MPMNVNCTTYSRLPAEEDRGGAIVDYVTDSLGSVITSPDPTIPPEGECKNIIACCILRAAGFFPPGQHSGL
jgi:hypothetical protein